MPIGTEIKKVRTSLTVWFNAVMGALALLPEALSLFAAALPGLAAYVPPSMYGKILIATVIGNIVIRVWFTAKPLTDAAAKRV
jgi:hypothetical protein